MRLRAPRPTHRSILVPVSLLLIAALTLTTTGASAQNVDSLRARAQQVTDQLAALETRASELDEQYLELGEELDELARRRAADQAAVDEARAAADAVRGEATTYLIEAYIGAGSDALSSVMTADVNESVNQRALLEIVRGDRQLVADSMDVSRADLEASVARLAESERALDERRAAQERVKAELEAAVSEHQRLLDGVNAELRSAVRAEQERREAAAARAAEQRRRAEATRLTTTATASARVAAAPATAAAPSRTPAPAPAPEPIPVNAPNGRAAGAIAAARSVLGTPYRWAGSTPAGFDCSGLMLWAWSHVGVSLPRTSRAQYAATQRISASQLQPGDLVFYGSPVHHVGMYVGDGQMIHSPRTGDVVKIAPIHRGFGNPSGYGRIG